jgi:tol-pal system protein YbgF
MKKALGAVLILILALSAAGQDRKEKAYELMYEDVQLLKLQFQRLEKKFDQAADDIRGLKDQVRDLLAQLRLVQGEQAKASESLRGVPSQYGALIDKLGQIDAQLTRLIDEWTALKPKPAEEAPEPGLKDGKTPAAKKPRETPVKKPGEQPKPNPDAGASVPVPANLSPQDVFNTAMADYGKGGFDLAVDGFSMYREAFPASPLADNALYMIGECRFSQKKYAPAVEAFDDLIMTYPLSDKIAAAYLKKGLSLAELKRRDEAVAVLRFLVAKYPAEEEARAAQEKIKELAPVK